MFDQKPKVKVDLTWFSDLRRIPCYFIAALVRHQSIRSAKHLRFKVQKAASAETATKTHRGSRCHCSQAGSIEAPWRKFHQQRCLLWIGGCIFFGRKVLHRLYLFFLAHIPRDGCLLWNRNLVVYYAFTIRQYPCISLPRKLHRSKPRAVAKTLKHITSGQIAFSEAWAACWNALVFGLWVCDVKSEASCFSLKCDTPLTLRADCHWNIAQHLRVFLKWCCTSLMLRHSDMMLVAGRRLAACTLDILCRKLCTLRFLHNPQKISHNLTMPRDGTKMKQLRSLSHFFWLFWDVNTVTDVEISGADCEHCTLKSQAPGNQRLCVASIPNVPSPCVERWKSPRLSPAAHGAHQQDTNDSNDAMVHRLKRQDWPLRIEVDPA